MRSDRKHPRPRGGRLISQLGLQLALGALVAAPAGAEIPRTPDGKPDLSGTYDVATLTPEERPRHFGDSLYLTPAQAARLADAARRLKAAGSEDQDPNRGAPPVGGDGSTGAAGNVGGYDSFWIDNGEAAFKLDGRFRTSIIYAPKDGRRPPLTADGRRRATARRANRCRGKGESIKILRL